MNIKNRSNKLSLAVSALTTTFVLSAAFESYAAVLEEVTVTARKREESLQEIPVAATVFNEQTLEMRGASDVSDITASVPNMAYQDRAGGHQTSIAIRGVSSDVRNIGIEDSVGIYVDGVYIGRPMFYNVDLAEVQQIEVLRGPQGTLFGKNSIAGALNITTKSVPQEFEGKVAVTAGSYGLRHYKAYFGGMFSDNLGGSLSAVKKTTDGYMENLTTGDDLQALDQGGVSGKLLFNASDSLVITLAADTSEKDNDVNASQLLAPSAGWGFETQSDPFEVRENGPQKYEENVDGYSVTAEYSFDNNYTLTFIGAQRNMDLLASFDDDNTPDLVDLQSIFEDESEQTSYELRLTSPGGQKFDWILGFFHFDQSVDSERHTLIPGSVDIAGSGTVEATSTAVYFSGDLHITDSLDLTLGVRYTRDEKKADWIQRAVPSGAFAFPDVDLSGDETWGEVSPTLALTYLINEDISVYGKVSEGFKGGGFVTDLVGESGFELEPETVRNYELGMKSTLADGAMRLNLALFRMEYDDLQTLDLGGPLNLQFVGANAGKATLQGLEFDLEYQVTDHLMIMGGAGYVHSEYDEFIQNTYAGTNDFAGNTLPNAPEITANLLLEYRTPVHESFDLVVIGEWSYKDETQFAQGNLDNTLAPSYSLYNARVGLTSSDDQWSVFLWGKNLGDEEYFTYLRDGPFTETTGLYGKPRSYGVSLTYNF
ncbi:TonB-dependent receptor [Aestuariicella sp. G3-2]|uniref:TonB-dependent receptor n=1 Tax=Pseudomaricurvus albidus TaxID=2842452 RepID=UPI001C0E6358|nr:TonB-dependent receptor [Aestuariicella albida]